MNEQTSLWPRGFKLKAGISARFVLGQSVDAVLAVGGCCTLDPRQKCCGLETIDLAAAFICRQGLEGIGP